MRIFNMCLTQRRGTFFLIAALLIAPGVFGEAAPSPVSGILDALVARLGAGKGVEEMARLDEATVLAALTPEERAGLSQSYWVFEVNVPVIVSVMRDATQETVPFWLTEQGFEKTALTARNENTRYEAWRKSFPAGRIGLGINGFDRHRPHYFVGVGPQDSGAALTIVPATPKDQAVLPFAPGSLVYHDWSELVLTETSPGFEGHVLLPTIRGRAREAHLLGAFRETPFLSGDLPDLPVLTWSDDPRHTQTIQWRSRSGQFNEIQYRPVTVEHQADWSAATAEKTRLKDRNIINDPEVYWHTATLTGLNPDTEYEYCLNGSREAAASFRTAPDAAKPFSFLWMSDTHNQPASIPLLAAALEKHPDAAFLSISGDLVGTGQHRDDWDQLFAHFLPFLQRRPLVPSIGNHDAIDGLGSELYRTLFRLPDNGPEGMKRGQTYALQYANLLLISLDVTDDIALQAPWLEKTLCGSDAAWKVAVLHFPPHAFDDDYPDIRASWCTLFDRCQVDVVLSGHVHYYLRSYPLLQKAPKVPAEKGPVYLISVAVPGRAMPIPKPAYAEVQDTSGVPTCQAFTVDAQQLTMHAYAADGTVRDSFTLKK